MMDTNTPRRTESLVEAGRWPTPPKNIGLPCGEIHVWAVQLDLSPTRHIELASTLSADENAKAERLHFACDRRRWIASRGQLREILGHYVQRDPATLTFCYACTCGDPHCTHLHRKPTLAADSWLNFNLSHSGDLAIVAVVRDRRVGIDLECRRHVNELLPLAGMICSQAELAAISTLSESNQSMTLLSLWTCKEAYVKARGIGLLLPPEKIEFTVALDGSSQLVRVAGDSDEAARWSVIYLPGLPNHVAALAVEGYSMASRHWRWR